MWILWGYGMDLIYITPYRKIHFELAFFAIRPVFWTPSNSRPLVSSPDILAILSNSHLS